jgi:hypothetical protein
MASQMNQLQYPNNAGYKKRRTSKIAGLEITKKAPTIRKQCLQIVKNKNTYGATPDEVADLLNLSILSVRPRFSELVLKGCIKDTKSTRKNKSGKSAIVWKYVKNE